MADWWHRDGDEARRGIWSWDWGSEIGPEYGASAAGGGQCPTLHASALMAPVSEISATNERYGASACLAGPAASSRGVVCDLDPPRTGTGQPRTSRSRQSSPKTTAMAASVDLGIRADFWAQVVRGRRRAHRGPRARDIFRTLS